MVGSGLSERPKEVGPVARVITPSRAYAPRAACLEEERLKIVHLEPFVDHLKGTQSSAPCVTSGVPNAVIRITALSGERRRIVAQP